MEIYLVGGAVRDQLLGIAGGDHDYVVVGATAEALLAQGYRPVGRDFPVFLHPTSNEEYALARIERKEGVGYHGFRCYAAPEVTLEEDLLRRDLTINAIAKGNDGRLVDPYGGIGDLKARILRHVSPAFSEDPLRVLRVARFAARFADLGFTIAPETVALMRSMTESGELETLTPERVWMEVAKALATNTPARFFEVLREIGALKVIAPEIDALFGVPAPALWHPEIDTGVHTLMVLTEAAKASGDIAVRFAALCHDLGKGVTPKELWPKHHGHELKGVPLLKQLAKRWRAPNHCLELAQLVMCYHTHSHKAFELRPETLLKLFNDCDLWRKPERFGDFLTACEADTRGREGFSDKPYPQRTYIEEAQQAAQAITAQRFVEAGLHGAAIAKAINEARGQAISEIKAKWRDNHPELFAAK